VFFLRVAYVVNRIRTGRLRLLRLWKRRELGDKARCKRAQEERVGRRSTGPCEKGAYEALSHEVSSGNGDKEADRIMERKLVELRQPGFQGWVCSECGDVFVMPDCALTGLTLDEITRHYKVMRQQAFDKHRCASLSEKKRSVQD